MQKFKGDKTRTRSNATQLNSEYRLILAFTCALAITQKGVPMFTLSVFPHFGSKGKPQPGKGVLLLKSAFRVTLLVRSD